MQVYGPNFARVYNLRWTAFATEAASQIMFFYENMPISLSERSLLDVCCGTGQLSAFFLQHGYRVTGIDLSEHMLKYATENAAPYLTSGKVEFICADASEFSTNTRFGLAVSTYDALNHLESESALKKCFSCVYDAVFTGGCFVFDLNTRSGLRRWNNIAVNEDRDVTSIVRGYYDGEIERATTHITGFVRNLDGHFDRFEETVFNQAFDLRRVHEALAETGWRHVHFSRLESLNTPLEEPENEGRVFIVAQK